MLLLFNYSSYFYNLVRLIFYIILFKISKYLNMISKIIICYLVIIINF